MGFDADRAQLLGALVIAGTAAGVSAFVGRSRRVAAAVALVVTLAIFGPTLASEAANLSAGRSASTLDLVGLAGVLSALVVVALLEGWAMATLAVDVRRGVDIVVGSIRSLRGDRSDMRRSLTSPLAGLAVVVSLGVALPIFGDMVTYGPYVPMQAGARPATKGPEWSSPGSATATPTPGPPTPGPPTRADPYVGGPANGVRVVAGAVLPARPWTSGPPVTGTSRIEHVKFRAPWAGGSTRNATVDVYLPPGYDAAKTARYPVMYSAPWGMAIWDKGVKIGATLDQLITTGIIPPQIVVFISQYGALYPSSECVDSFDGRQLFDRYITRTVVPYVDSNYLTIARPAARSVLGFSEGGYCAALLVLRHPDLFSLGAAISGYYRAAARSGSTATAWRVFGGDPGLIAANSPVLLAGRLPAVVRPRMFLLLVAQPTEPFFGKEYRDMRAALTAAGLPHGVMELDNTGHSWWAVGASLAGVLQTLAARQVAEGVFSAG